jgi:peptide-methionine (S)-S-oxide reductase
MNKRIYLILFAAAAIAVAMWLIERPKAATESSQAPSAPTAPVAAAPPGPAADVAVAPASTEGLEVATFSSGCFWCTESDFDKVAGVVTTTSGYTGGTFANPTYEQVSAGGTGHAESLELRFDSKVVTYEQLLDVYWHNVDPFSAHGQFCDYGEQYRPVIWVHDARQRTAAEASKARVERDFKRPVVVTIENAGAFYPAEDYHQDFHVKSAVRYKYYRWGCGRDARLADLWGSTTY